MKKLLYITLLSLFTLVYNITVIAIEPLALYLTWQQDPTSTMTILWITRPEQQEDFLAYQKIDENEWHSAKGKHVLLPNGSNCVLHTVQLGSLDQGTGYRFRISDCDSEFKFRTVPKDLSNPVTFVAGGDIYRGSIDPVIDMNRQAAKTNPYFALLGGDIAYSVDSGKTMRWWVVEEKIDRWLDFLNAWTKTMVTYEGYLIPLIPTIGNHETLGDEEQTPDKAVFFYALFPMPGKQGYAVLDFGNYLSILVMDSGITHTIDREQAQWLENTLQQRQQIPYKFAIYHIGAFPSHRSPDGKWTEMIRRYWVPKFEKYHLTAAFENHDHAYKRTFPLANGKIDPSGVLYLGDGCWGIPGPRVPEKRWYIAHCSSDRHIYVTTLKQDSCQFKAIGQQGNIVDEFSR